LHALPPAACQSMDQHILSVIEYIYSNFANWVERNAFAEAVLRKTAVGQLSDRIKWSLMEIAQKFQNPVLLDLIPSSESSFECTTAEDKWKLLSERRLFLNWSWPTLLALFIKLNLASGRDKHKNVVKLMGLICETRRSETMFGDMMGDNLMEHYRNDDHDTVIAQKMELLQYIVGTLLQKRSDWDDLTMYSSHLSALLWSCSYPEEVISALVQNPALEQCFFTHNGKLTKVSQIIILCYGQWATTLFESLVPGSEALAALQEVKKLHTPGMPVLIEARNALNSHRICSSLVEIIFGFIPYESFVDFKTRSKFRDEKKKWKRERQEHSDKQNAGAMKKLCGARSDDTNHFA
jgi:hypothetical protein